MPTTFLTFLTLYSTPKNRSIFPLILPTPLNKSLLINLCKQSIWHVLRYVVKVKILPWLLELVRNAETGCLHVFDYTIVLCTDGEPKENLQFKHNKMNKLKIRKNWWRKTSSIPRWVTYNRSQSFELKRNGDALTIKIIIRRNAYRFLWQRC